MPTARRVSGPRRPMPQGSGRAGGVVSLETCEITDGPQSRPCPADIKGGPRGDGYRAASAPSSLRFRWASNTRARSSAAMARRNVARAWVLGTTAGDERADLAHSTSNTSGPDHFA